MSKRWTSTKEIRFYTDFSVRCDETKGWLAELHACINAACAFNPLAFAAWSAQPFPPEGIGAQFIPAWDEIAVEDILRRAEATTQLTHRLITTARGNAVRRGLHFIGRLNDGQLVWAAEHDLWPHGYELWVSDDGDGLRWMTAPERRWNNDAYITDIQNTRPLKYRIAVLSRRLFRDSGLSSRLLTQDTGGDTPCNTPPPDIYGHDIFINAVYEDDGTLVEAYRVRGVRMLGASASEEQGAQTLSFPYEIAPYPRYNPAPRFGLYFVSGNDGTALSKVIDNDPMAMDRLLWRLRQEEYEGKDGRIRLMQIRRDDHCAYWLLTWPRTDTARPVREIWKVCPSSSSYPWLDGDILLKLQIQEWERTGELT